MVRHQQPPLWPQNVRVVLTDGAAHAVDSSEMAFRIASIQAFRLAYGGAGAQVGLPLRGACQRRLW